jgi:hypothetical protein
LSDPNLANCSYVRSDYRPPSQGTVTIAYHPPTGGALTVLPAVYRPAVRPVLQPVAAPEPSTDGAWYVYRCSGQGWRDALFRLPVWMPNRPGPGSGLPSPAELARLAYEQLRLPTPQIRANPTGTQLVNLPTWLWVDRGSWADRTATASVPGVSVTATAKPTSVTWSMGDGSTLTCPGAGTPFAAGGDPKAASPDCGHTYRASSQGRPNNTFPVSVTVHWTVTWAGAGQSGTFPDLTMTQSTTFAVAESQAVTTG